MDWSGRTWHILAASPKIEENRSGIGSVSDQMEKSGIDTVEGIDPVSDRIGSKLRINKYDRAPERGAPATHCST